MKQFLLKRKFEPDDSSAKPEAGTTAPDKPMTKACMLLFLLPLHSHHSLQIPSFLKLRVVFRISTKVSYTLHDIEYPWC